MIKRRIYRGLVAIGRLARLKRYIDPDDGSLLRVLMYHSISTEPGPLIVSPESFARQQELLADQYKVVSLDQVAASIRDGSQLPARAVLLTFDDGYRDNLEVAKPILDNYGHPATIFVATSYLGSKLGLSHGRGTMPTLSWDELRELAHGFSVGSQGCTHRVLTRIPAEDAKRELSESKRAIEDHLGRPVTAFCYPKGSIGDFSPQLEKQAVAAGYRTIFTSLPGINRQPFDPHRIKRHHVEDFGMDYFEALLNGSAALLALKDTRPGYWAKRALKRWAI